MPKTVEYPSRERLLEALEYNPETGRLTWRRNVSSTGRAGSEAGCRQRSGYTVVRLDKRLLLAHRVIWIMMTGERPPECIDHVNHIKSDNRWANLRRSDKVENGQNRRGAQVNNLSTGCRNVYFLGRGNRQWFVQIQVPGGRVRKTFYTLLDAACFAQSARLKLHAGHPLNA